VHKCFKTHALQQGRKLGRHRQCHDKEPNCTRTAIRSVLQLQQLLIKCRGGAAGDCMSSSGWLSIVIVRASTGCTASCIMGPNSRSQRGSGTDQRPCRSHRRSAHHPDRGWRSRSRTRTQSCPPGSCRTHHGTGWTWLQQHNSKACKTSEQAVLSSTGLRKLWAPAVCAVPHDTPSPICCTVG